MDFGVVWPEVVVEGLIVFLRVLRHAPDKPSNMPCPLAIYEKHDDGL